MVFEDYGKYYDALYSDKDYRHEAAYVTAKMLPFVGPSRRLLELGCGTGRHAMHFAEAGLTVVAIDLSHSMLSFAERRRAELSEERRRAIQFLHGDAREFRLDEPCSAVVSLFHVVCYQCTNNDLDRLFASVSANLTTGGTFVFDAWYGPAVLTDRPYARHRVVHVGGQKVIRLSEPTIDVATNCVHVKYTLLLLDTAAGTVSEIQELHTMRYLFVPEVERLAESNGMHVQACTKWMTDQPADDTSWNVCFQLRKR